MDALGQRFGKADSLYNLYMKTASEINAPVYCTMGNHDIFGIYKKYGTDTSHPEYGEKMFENRLGKSYYSFDHKGWKFIILNSVEEKDNRYIGLVDPDQLEWIRSELENTDKQTPIVISTHLPLITAFTQVYSGSTTPNGESLVITNSKEVLDLFDGYNLKLVLQGHLHILEDIYIFGTHFITGGAISAGWWKGPYETTEEGFIKIDVEGDNFRWEYIDYGWVPETAEGE